MLIVAILVGVCQIITFLGMGLLFKVWFERKQAHIEARISSTLREWGEPQGEGKPSKAAEVLDAMGAVVGAAAARSIMASLSVDQSHVARQANTLADIAQGRQNPVLGLLSGGKRGKGAALARLAEIIGPMLAGGQGGNGNHPEEGVASRSIRDRLGGR